MKQLLFWIYAFIATLAFSACGGSNDESTIPVQPSTINSSPGSADPLTSDKTAQCGLALFSGGNVVADICQIGAKAANCSASNAELTNQAALVTSQLGVSTTYSFTPSCGETLSATGVATASDALITTLRSTTLTGVQITGNLNLSGTSAISTNNLLPLNTGSTPLTLSNTANIGTIVLGGSGNLNTHVSGTGDSVSTTVATAPSGTLINTGSAISIGSTIVGNSGTLSLSGAAMCRIDLSAGGNVLANVCLIGIKAANCTASNTDLTTQAAQVTTRLSVSVTYTFTPACGEALSASGLSPASDALVTTLGVGDSASVEISGSLILTGSSTLAIANSVSFVGTSAPTSILSNTSIGNTTLGGSGNLTLNSSGAGITGSSVNIAGTGGTLVLATGATISPTSVGTSSSTGFSLSSTGQCGIALTSANNTLLANICYANVPASSCSASNPLFASSLQQVGNLLGQPFTPSVTPLCAARPDYTFTLN